MPVWRAVAEIDSAAPIAAGKGVTSGGKADARAAAAESPLMSPHSSGGPCIRSPLLQEEDREFLWNPPVNPRRNLDSVTA
jgi:hypothetical protein